MSEFQYYEFQAIDRPLTAQDKAHVQSLSSRAKVTKTQAIFSYAYSDFRGQPEDLLDRCFDIMLYVASFGVRYLFIRFPKDLVDARQFGPYDTDQIETVVTEKSVILKIQLCCEDYYDWIDDENDWLDGLVDIRQEILNGDWRSLYLAWLKIGFTEDCSIDPDEATEPPVPPNLQELSPALEAFAEFFKIDADLIAVAAEGSVTTTTNEQEPLADWIAALPEAERNDYLLRVVQGENVGTELLHHLRKLHNPAPEGSPPGTRTLGELMRAAKEAAEEREYRKLVTAKEERRYYLEHQVAPKAESIWETVEDLVRQKKSKTYDEAVKQLIELRDLAQQQNQLAQFQGRLGRLRDRYPTLRSFRDRLEKAKLQP